MIKEKINKIIEVEKEASQIILKAKDDAAKAIRLAHQKSVSLIAEVQDKRKEIIQKKIEESEKKGKSEAKRINENAQADSSSIKAKANINLKKAVTLVFERVVKYGDK